MNGEARGGPVTATTGGCAGAETGPPPARDAGRPVALTAEECGAEAGPPAVGADARVRQLAVYAAEEAALAGAGRGFRHLGEVRAYLDDLVGSDWWADRWPQVEAIPVGRTRSGRFSGYAVEGTGEIRVGPLREPVVLHEVAHVVTPGAGHGAAFVEALLALVRERLGFHAYGALLAELRNRHVVGR